MPAFGEESIQVAFSLFVDNLFNGCPDPPCNPLQISDRPG